jgi:NAD(P)-dependent dehydrogenase (short-subunit alcohol dehydrogenase family)
MFAYVLSSTSVMDLKNKIALVTGGTRGIGAAAALSLAREGADIAVLGRRKDEETLATVQSVQKLGRRCEFIPGDCGRPDQCRAAVAQTISKLGTIDILVHAAGGPVNGGLMQLTDDQWHDAFNVHVHAIFHLCKAAIPTMQSKKAGAVVLVSSTAGIRGVITNVAYQVVKGALPQFTRALAREFADDNIRVNCVAPGVVRTAFHASMTDEQRKLNLEKRIPLHREGTPEQVATVILELIKNEYITGETVTIDGGLTMRIA